MADAVNAFGIYRQEVSPKAKPVRLGVEGRISSNTIRFWTAEFYVKLTTPPGGGRMPELEALGAPSRRAGRAGEDAGGGRLVSVGRSGAGFGQVHPPRRARGRRVHEGLRAKYENPGGTHPRRSSWPFDSDQTAAAALARYESFSQAPRQDEGGRARDGGFSPPIVPGFHPGVRAGSSS